jgi:hypothetical protein
MQTEQDKGREHKCSQCATLDRRTLGSVELGARAAQASGLSWIHRVNIVRAALGSSWGTCLVSKNALNDHITLESPPTMCPAL